MAENNNLPKVSILLPTYNRARLITETIQSVRQQTYSNWELIIIDDGSDDDTENVVTQIEDKRIQFHMAGRTGMVGKLKNLGLKRAQGELIAFIDSDDLWARTKLEKQIASLQKYPEAGFSLTNGFNFKKLTEPLDHFYKQREGIRYENIFIPFFKSEIATTTPSLLLRKECLHSAGFFKESKPFADVEFILELARHFKAVILYEPLFFRRVHDTNDSDSNWIKRHHEGIELILSYEKHLPKNVLKDSLFRSFINFGEKSLKHKMKKQAIKSFFSALQQKPYSATVYKKIAKTMMSYLKGE